MAWNVQRTDSYEKWCKTEKVDEKNFMYHVRALEQFQNVQLPHNVQTRIFKNLSYECWVTRLPDKVRKEGKSGGFRVVIIIDLEEKIIYLQGIFRRSHLQFQNEKGKYDTQYANLLEELASEFVEISE